MSDEIPVEIKGLVPTPAGTGVFLGHGDKAIAIFIDSAVAMAITMQIENVERPRPLTHDLINSIFLGMGIRAVRVVIHDLKDGTFFARLHLLQENENGRQVAEIDARPSDCLAIALQQKCPVVVTRKVWEAADDMSWALQEATGNTPPPSENDDPKTDEDEE